MPIANTLKRYLNSSKVNYYLISHPVSGSSMETAESASVSGYKLAKGVVLKDKLGYLMAVLPSTRHVEITILNELTGRDLELIEEDEVGRLFDDCDLGAIPPLGDAYRLEVLLDSALSHEETIYFESGDHHDLVQVSGEDFQKLQENARSESFAR